jgi:hypothetical protein
MIIFEKQGNVRTHLIVLLDKSPRAERCNDGYKIPMRTVHTMTSEAFSSSASMTLAMRLRNATATRAAIRRTTNRVPTTYTGHDWSVKSVLEPAAAGPRRSLAGFACGGACGCRGGAAWRCGCRDGYHYRDAAGTSGCRGVCDCRDAGRRDCRGVCGCHGADRRGCRDADGVVSGGDGAQRHTYGEIKSGR